MASKKIDKSIKQIEQIMNSAKLLEQAGCFAIVLELMPAESAEFITQNLKIRLIE